MIATLQRDHVRASSDLQGKPGVLYYPPASLCWVFDDDPAEQLLSPYGDLIQIEHQTDGGMLLTCALDDVRRVTCQLDADGRPLSIEEHRPFGRLTAEYEYAEDGRLLRETMIQFAAEQLVRGLHADYSYGDDGTRHSVQITNLTGRIVEVQSYNPLGLLDEWHTLNDACQVSCREQFRYNPSGLLASSYRQRFATTEPWHPVRDWTETREYSPQSGTLLRSTLTERRNDAEPEEHPDWTTVVVETIDYDPEQEGAPLRDETQYFDCDLLGDLVLCKRILMHHRATDSEGAEAVRVIDEDLCSGEVRERWHRRDG